MNKELASILKDRIAPFPFIDVLAGLVQTVEEVHETENGTVRKRFPLSSDTNMTDACAGGLERALTPDSSKKSVIYFEDFGSQVTREGRNGAQSYISTIRLVAWLNRERLTGDAYTSISGYCIAAICRRLDLKFENTGIFQRLRVNPSRIPIQDASLFSRYTYDEAERQYLLPPFEVFAIDFSCSYHVKPGCITEIDFNNPSLCL